MPNHCHNRVTFYSANTDAVAKLKQIFTDENCFTQIIPEPDWENTPLMSKDVKEYSFSEPKGKVGELPQYVDSPYLSVCMIGNSPTLPLGSENEYSFTSLDISGVLIQSGSGMICVKTDSPVNISLRVSIWSRDEAVLLPAE